VGALSAECGWDGSYGHALKLDDLCAELMPEGREAIAWGQLVAVLVIARLLEPSSELHIAQAWYRTTALEDLLGIPSESIYDNRLYRALDRLLPHKPALEQHLRRRLGELFALEYDLLLYDVTSTTSRVWPKTIRSPGAAIAATIVATANRYALRWW
jgi:hypothetical protein